MDGTANKKMDKMISSVMSNLGSRGKGASKIRGNKKYYQHLVKIREAKRKSRAIEDAVKKSKDIDTTPASC